MMPTTNKVMEASAFADWVRVFAVSALPVCANPSLELVRQAIATHFPEALAEVSPDASAQELLEKILGIAIIVQFNMEHIAWTATANPAEADLWRHRYSGLPYSQARHDLGVDGLWIFLVDPESLGDYGLDELIAKGPYSIEMYKDYPHLLRMEDRKECVVVKL